MTNKQKNSVSIKDRLRQLSLVVILFFVLMGVTLYFNSRNVRQSLDQIVVGSFNTIVDNSQSSRNFGLLQVRLNVFKNNFYLDDNWFETESRGILHDIELLKTTTKSPELTPLLSQLQEQFSVYLERRSWVNFLLFWRSEQDKDIGDVSLLIQDIIDEKISEAKLVGAEVGSLNELKVWISTCRMSLFEIAKLNAEENPVNLLSVPMDTPPPLTNELSNLITQLQPLTAAAPPVDRLGKHLIDHFYYYQYLMLQYQAVMVRLGELDRNLDQLSTRILASMEQLDQLTVSAVGGVRREIKHSILTSVTFVQVILFVLAILTWLFLNNLFKKHFQSPLEMVGTRLKQFEDGDHHSLMQLNRHDEWNDIETGFNRMLSSLSESVVALKKSEKHYRGIYNSITEGIFRITLSGKFTDLNPAAISILGFESLAEGLNYFSDAGEKLFVDPQAQQRMMDLLRDKKKLINHEVEMYRQGGDVFWASLNCYLVHNEQNHEVGVEGVITDITSRKRAQDALRQLQSYLQNIIDSMPSILIGVNTDLKVTLWNKRAEQESAFTAVEAEGLPLEEICQLFSPALYLSQLEETFRIGKSTRLRKIESLKKGTDGRSRFFDLMIFPLSLAGTSGAVIHIDDVTERTRLEEIMIQSEKMSSIGGLAAGLAHEINNPLAVILQSVQVLSRRLSPDLEKNQKTAEDLGTTIEALGEYIRLRGCEKMLHSISHAGQRAARIVETMQNFSQRGESNFIFCSISDLLERTVELAGSDYDMRHRFDFKEINVVREYQTVPEVYCDAGQIQQAILTLLKNAAQALSQNLGEARLTLKLSRCEESYVCLQVEDNGSGMEAEVAAQIFEPFYTTQEVGQGLGLGLSIAYFIVTDNHRGRLSVTSVPGTGSCFEMVLPIKNSDDLFS
ncbi:MAG: hypothetical protein DRH07_06290 [Deltaproteobacteria bacterium]|nr:MAG: hypothetical protein DRH07_06290 [Deltaproteobacteria bacterium]